MKKVEKMKRVVQHFGVAAALFSGVLFPAAACAEPISQEDYETKTVDAYLFDKDHKTSVELVFKKDLPEIPYIDAADFLNPFFKTPLREELQEDGAICVYNSEHTMIVDPEEDTICFLDIAGFLWGGIDPGEDMEAPYMSELVDDEATEKVDITFDLKPYDIDLLNIDGKAYIPLATLSDIVSPVYSGAQYLNDELYFVHTSEILGPGLYYDNTAVLEQTERSEAEAKFTYNELCFMMDSIYGLPAKASISASIKEKGLDATMDEDTSLSVAKEYLKSTNNAEYMAGILYLQIALYDGGHTNLVGNFLQYVDKYPEAPLSAAFISLLKDSDYEGTTQVFQLLSGIEGVREEEENALSERKIMNFVIELDTVKTWYKDGTGESLEDDNIIATLYDAGDTMIFSFDSFDNPVVYAFKESVDYAADHGKKNFIVDVTTNGGGLTSVYGYMLTLMKNKNRNSNRFTDLMYNRILDETDESDVMFDLNLDGVFDAKDAAVGYDLNFAILESKVSFSSGNAFPVYAREFGIAVFGETSGGGECNLAPFFFQNGLFGMISGPSKSETLSGAVVDDGAEPDYALVKSDDDGNKDYSLMYNVKLLDRLVHEYYGDYTNEWAEGVWYDKNHKGSYEGIGAWTKLDDGCWTYKDSLGWYPKNRWQKIDGKWYFFDKDGCMEANAYKDGYYLTKSGAWDGKAKAAGWKQDSKGWWYSTGSKTYLKNTWMKIDGKWYYFKSNGYAAQNEFVNGWWCNQNCIQSDPVRYSWHKTSKGWWYGVKNGWYAKNASYTIDGKAYKFNKAGYSTDK